MGADFCNLVLEILFYKQFTESYTQNVSKK